MATKPRTVTFANGKKVTVQAPEGATKEEAANYARENVASFEATTAAKKAESEPMPWADVAGGVKKNFAKSGIQLGKDVAQMVVHPIDTATSLLGLAKGAIELMVPGEQGNEEKARSVGRHFKKRYGTFEAGKRTLAADPVGFAADLSAFISGGGTLAAKTGIIAGKTAKLAKKLGVDRIPQMAKNARGPGASYNTTGAIEKAGSMGRELAKPGAVPTAAAGPNWLQTAGEATARFGNKIDPLTIAGKGVGKVAVAGGNLIGDLQGVATGRGGMATKEAFQAGMKGEKNKLMGGDAGFEAGMKHLDDADVVVAEAEGLLMDLAESRKAEYTDKLAKLVQGNKAGKYSMNVQPVHKKLLELGDSLRDLVTGEHSIITNAGERANIAQIVKETAKILDDPRMHNALGMDHLKKVLDNIDIPKGATSNHRQANRIRATMSSMVKKEIKKVVPDYEAMLLPYEQGLRLERELKHAFSLGSDAHVDTIIKKLQSSLAEGVHSGLGTKRKTLGKLDPSGKLARKLAGHALSTPMPTGMMRAGMGIGAGAGGGAGFLAGGPVGAAVGMGLTVGAQSPKLTGKLNYAAGRAASPVYKAGKALGEEGMRNVGRGLVAAGRAKQIEEADAKMTLTKSPPKKKKKKGYN